MNQSEATSKFIERSQTDTSFTLSQEMTFQELASMGLVNPDRTEKNSNHWGKFYWTSYKAARAILVNFT